MLKVARLHGFPPKAASSYSSKNMKQNENSKLAAESKWLFVLSGPGINWHPVTSVTPPRTGIGSSDPECSGGKCREM